ncbi:MAG: CRISPR-associated protein Csx15 [Anaerolineae bacterium]
MILLNFTHPLSQSQLQQLQSAVGEQIERTIYVPVQFEHDRSFVEQVRELADAAGLSPEEWQSVPILLIPPALNFIAVTLLAELHGRMGYFPPIVRLRPVHETLPPCYEVAEIINLQAVRDAARTRR